MLVRKLYSERARRDARKRQTILDWEKLEKELTWEAYFGCWISAPAHQTLKSLYRGLKGLVTYIIRKVSITPYSLKVISLKQFLVWELESRWTGHTLQGQEMGWGASDYLGPALRSTREWNFFITSSNKPEGLPNLVVKLESEVELPD